MVKKSQRIIPKENSPLKNMQCDTCKKPGYCFRGSILYCAKCWESAQEDKYG